jgi:hypothetical protein
LVGAHWLEGAAAAPMTNEQRLRGADAGVASALLVTAYDDAALDVLGRAELSAARLQALGATEVVAGRYRLDVTLTATEMAPPAGLGSIAAERSAPGPV